MTALFFVTCKKFLVGMVILRLLIIISGTAHAVPFTKDVFCDTEKCGTMEITTYEEFTGNATFPSNKWLGGVEIKGDFKNVAKSREYHYLQSIKTESDTFRWINDASVKYPQPFLDVPPGGHKVRDAAGSATFVDQVFDYLPWYDGGDPPPFFDKPSDWMLPAKEQMDKKLEWDFETWLIYVIQDMHDNDQQAKDDTYKVAPLLGWRWGYDLIYKDIGVIGTDEFADFTVAKKPFEFVTSPAADWTSALSAKYGDPAKSAAQDFWNITIGSCKDCLTIPEPASILLLLPGFLALVCLGNCRV
jgi:hypothetical protein